MATVPVSDRPRGPKIDESFLMMAAAQMHQEGFQAEPQVQQVSDVKRGMPQSGTETEGAKDVAAIGGAAGGRTSIYRGSNEKKPYELWSESEPNVKLNKIGEYATSDQASAARQALKGRK